MKTFELGKESDGLKSGSMECPDLVRKIASFVSYFSKMVWTTIDGRERLNGYKGRLVILVRQFTARNRLVTGGKGSPLCSLCLIALTPEPPERGVECSTG